MKTNMDSEIWQRFRKGDEKAFAYIFDTYHLQLFEYGQRFSADAELVGDSIQDLFFELASKREKLSATDNILFYLLKSLRIKIFNNLRKNRYVSSAIRPDQLDEFRLEYSTDADAEEKELRIDRLSDAINQLPPRQKETIYLKFYKNLSNAEVAEVMQVNYQSVSNSIQKAIQKLKVLLESDTESIILFFQTCIRQTDAIFNHMFSGKN
ncbi:RNA polymerase sigma factor [Gaoshiqia sp. Z1-71]|uniref:RNA polymerase sigma factor n=1 Tax=Gaoshiqia hydrogeniformans TaxID=3290090 RepID=UPI003BF8EFEE